MTKFQNLFWIFRLFVNKAPTDLGLTNVFFSIE
jgi:hypothetical protein